MEEHKKSKQELKEKAQKLLPKPGVYRMMDKHGHLLYIGKSKCLPNRVASYFSQSSQERSKKIARMIKQIDDFQVYYTDTELDALLLECRWIQQQKPPYNTLLNRTGRYRYFDIINKDGISLKLRRKPEKDALLSIGPLTHKQLARNAYLFMKRYYKELFPKPSLSESMFIKEGVSKIYTNPVESLEKEALHKEGEMLNNLEKQMAMYAEKWAYEEAQEVLEAIKGLKYLQYTYHLNTVTIYEEWIGKLPIGDTFFYKYYRVSKGLVIKTLKGTLQEENKIIEELKQIKIEDDTIEKRHIASDDIDPIRIIESFKERGMYFVKV